MCCLISHHCHCGLIATVIYANAFKLLFQLHSVDWKTSRVSSGRLCLCNSHGTGKARLVNWIMHRRHNYTPDTFETLNPMYLHSGILITQG